MTEEALAGGKRSYPKVDCIEKSRGARRVCVCEREIHREVVRGEGEKGGGRGRAGWYTRGPFFTRELETRRSRERRARERRVGRRLAAGVAARGGARGRKVDGGKDGPRAGPT